MNIFQRVGMFESVGPTVCVRVKERERGVSKWLGAPRGM